MFENEIIETYKYYYILVAPAYQKEYRFNYSHIDYTGPPDRRCGFAKTIEDCKKQINEIENELY